MSAVEESVKCLRIGRVADEHLVAVVGGVAESTCVAYEGTDAPTVGVEGANDVSAEVAGRSTDDDGLSALRGGVWR